ncbi:putative oxidoreductase,short chain dehydrogenase [Xylaria sp. FL1777]|nr:putative oxidoreductase,short chain dehydrogenase [Xylaria sp. FL1777]
MAGKVIGLVGLFTISSLCVKLFKLTATYLRPSRLDRFRHLSQHGEPPWALVTGASDGIGRAFTYELAANGFNVVLHGRNDAKLSRVKADLSDKYPQHTFRILVADASAVACTPCLSTQQSSEKGVAPLDFTAIQRELDDINLTVLVNNAGGGPYDPVCLPVWESPESKITANISLNALFPLHLTRVLLPNLIRNSPSLVINISTMVDQGFPLLASYSASKQFLMAITRALRLELQMEGVGDGVEILGIKIGRVTGARGCTQPVSLFVPNAETMAKAALARAGNGYHIVVGYWAHALQQLGGELLGLLPTWYADRVHMDIMRQERLALDGDTKPVKQS